MNNFQDAEPYVEFAYKKSKELTIPKGFQNFITLFSPIKMKISIGSHIIVAWGGGNLFIINLSNYLIKRYTVVYDLIDKDIDLIPLTDPEEKLFFII